MDDFKAAGRYTITFQRRGLPDGVYFYRLRVGAYTRVKVMSLVR